jgi:hypothetical protein
MATTTEKIDIASCIAELLHLHDRVVLPGVGALEGSYKPAAVDQIQGKIAPPSKKLSFNPLVKLSDGALTNLIAQKTGWSLTKSQIALDEYLAGVQQSLAKREIVEIAGVGRLYLDFEGQYKFIAGPQNFNGDSFGLPELRFNPLKRQHAAVPASGKLLKPAKPTPAKGFDLRSPVVWILSIAILALAFSLFFLFREMLSPPAAEAVRPPVTTQPGAPPIAGEDEDEDPGQDEDYAFVQGALGELVDTEAPTRAPGVREAVVIIGTFKDDSNAARQIQTLFSDGYEGYSDKHEGVTRVGIRLPFSEEAELQRQLQTIRNKYNPKAWVFYPDN